MYSISGECRVNVVLRVLRILEPTINTVVILIVYEYTMSIEYVSCREHVLLIRHSSDLLTSIQSIELQNIFQYTSSIHSGRSTEPRNTTSAGSIHTIEPPDTASAGSGDNCRSVEHRIIRAHHTAAASCTDTPIYTNVQQFVGAEQKYRRTPVSPLMLRRRSCFLGLYFGAPFLSDHANTRARDQE